MNERIRKLALQAGLGNHLWLDIPDSEDVQVTEKFAEFIIKECADYIRTNYDNWEAEPLAFNMETDFGLHRDYAE